jgi:5-hydroxyisourate hydrolase
MKAPITTHILDTSAGRPAAAVTVALLKGSKLIASGLTDEHGRVADWDKTFQLESTDYTLRFDVGPYFARNNEASIYSDIQIKFKVDSIAEHYHVPLLLNPFGYSTYRGS